MIFNSTKIALEFQYVESKIYGKNTGRFSMLESKIYSIKISSISLIPN